MNDPQRVKFMKWGNAPESWWAIARKGSKFGKANSARAACALWLSKKVHQADI